MTEKATQNKPVELLDLWNSVCETDPRYTKQFTRGGGFSGTAINHTYLIRRATEMWGPIGGMWRVEIIQQGLMDGAPLVDYTGNKDAPDSVVVVGHEKIHFVHIRLTYPVFGKNDAGEKVHMGEGRVEHFGQTTFVGQNKKGFFTDEEAPKKSLTDAIGKALSMLGFCADVYLGLFDDNKYVNDRKAQAERESGAEVRASARERVDPAELDRVKRELSDCETLATLQSTYMKLPQAMMQATKEFVRTLATGLRNQQDRSGDQQG